MKKNLINYVWCGQVHTATWKILKARKSLVQHKHRTWSHTSCGKRRHAHASRPKVWKHRRVSDRPINLSRAAAYPTSLVLHSYPWRGLNSGHSAAHKSWNTRRHKFVSNRTHVCRHAPRKPTGFASSISFNGTSQQIIVGEIHQETAVLHVEHRWTTPGKKSANPIYPRKGVNASTPNNFLIHVFSPHKNGHMTHFI